MYRILRPLLGVDEGLNIAIDYFRLMSARIEITHKIIMKNNISVMFYSI